MIKYVQNDQVVYRWTSEGGHNRYFDAVVKSVHGHLVRIALKIKGGEHQREVEPETLMLRRTANPKRGERTLWDSRSSRK